MNRDLSIGGRLSLWWIVMKWIVESKNFKIRHCYCKEQFDFHSYRTINLISATIIILIIRLSLIVSENWETTFHNGECCTSPENACKSWSLKCVQRSDQAEHSYVWKSLTKWDTLMWHPAISYGPSLIKHKRLSKSVQWLWKIFIAVVDK